MRFSTKQIHAGIEVDPTTGSILTPIYQTTTYVQPSVDEYLSKGYSYSRSGNPTVRALERKITLLEDGHDTTCFSSGMAAIQATMLALLNAGDHAVISEVAYGGTHRLCTQVLNRFGVEFTFADTSDADNVRKALRDNTRLIFTETPANPTLKLTDIAAVSAVVGDREALSALLTVPRWYFVAGLISVIVVGTSTYLIPRLGAVNVFVIFVGAQLLVRMVLSHFGWLQSPLSPINGVKLLGAVLLLTGAILVVRD